MARGSVQEISVVTHTFQEALQLAEQDNLSAFRWGGMVVHLHYGKSGLTDVYVSGKIEPSDAERGAVVVRPPSEI